MECTRRGMSRSRRFLPRGCVRCSLRPIPPPVALRGCDSSRNAGKPGEAASFHGNAGIPPGSARADDRALVAGCAALSNVVAWDWASFFLLIMHRPSGGRYTGLEASRPGPCEFWRERPGRQVLRPSRYPFSLPSTKRKEIPPVAAGNGMAPHSGWPRRSGKALSTPPGR